MITNGRTAVSAGHVVKRAIFHIDKDLGRWQGEGLSQVQEQLGHHISVIREILITQPFKPDRKETRLEHAAESDKPPLSETIAVGGREGSIRIGFDKASLFDIPGITSVIEREFALGRQGQGNQGEKDGKKKPFHGLFLLQLDIGLDLESSTIPAIVAFLGASDFRSSLGRCVFSAVFLSVDVLEDNLDVIGTLKYGPD